MRFISSALIAALLLCVPLAALCSEELSYTVRPGDTLERVVEEFGTEGVGVEDLRRFNNLKSVQRIPPGTKIRFRLGWLKIKPLQAVAAAVSGEARVVRAGRKEAEDVVQGDGFKPGDVLETGADSSVLLKFGDGSQLLLQGNSALAFEILESYGDRDIPGVRLFLHRGRIDTEIAPNESPDRRFEIRTPVGSAGARGTRFRVAAESRTQLTEVTHGTVAVVGGKDGGALAVEENFGTVAEAGRPPIPPVELLPPPDLGTVEQRYRRLPARVAWRGMVQAIGYRALLKRADTPDVTVLDRVTSEPHIELQELTDGDYILLVRALDSHRLEGLEAERRFTLDAHPLPPLAAVPERERLLLGEDELVLRWQGSPAAVSYHLQLAADENFGNLIVDRERVDGTSYAIVESLSPRRYYWRIASRDSSGKRGPFGAAQQFELAQRPGPPAGLEIRKTADELRLRWHEERPGLRYHLQLAADREFTRLLEERELDAASVALARPPERSYLRIRAIDSHGTASGFTTPIEIVPPMPGYLPAVLMGVLGLVLL